MPLDLRQHLERQMCKFWWKSDAKKDKNINWQSWSQMCKRKSASGMGFRCLRDFNIALLGKQGWRLLKYPEKLVSKIYKAHYYLKGSNPNAKIENNPSYIWGSMLESHSIISQGIECRIVNGRSIMIMDDPWLPQENNFFIQTINSALQNQTVSSLMSITENAWDVDLILDTFNTRDAGIILSTHIRKRSQ